MVRAFLFILFISLSILVTLYVFLFFQVIPPFNNNIFDYYYSTYNPNYFIVPFILLLYIIFFFLFNHLENYYFNKANSPKHNLIFDTLPHNFKILIVFLSFSLMFCIIFVYLSSISNTVYYKMSTISGQLSDGTYWDRVQFEVRQSAIIFLFIILILFFLLSSMILSFFLRIRLNIPDYILLLISLVLTWRLLIYNKITEYVQPKNDNSAVSFILIIILPLFSAYLLGNFIISTLFFNYDEFSQVSAKTFVISYICMSWPLFFLYLYY